MTTNSPSPQQQFGSGAPVATAPNGTRYFNTDVTPLAEYICINGVWQSISAGAGSIAQVVLTSAQILALHTTPINIIPAQGAGTLIIVGSVTYKGTGAYTNAGGSGLVYHGLALAADNSFLLPANPWINGVKFAAGLDLTAAAANVSVQTALGLGVDISGVAADPTVGVTPATVTATYKVITP